MAIMKVVAVEKIDLQGISKKGSAYHIDEVRLTVALPFDKDGGFGIKTHEYRYGKASDFIRFLDLRGKLPCDMDITLETQINEYGQPVTVVSAVDILPPKSAIKG